MNLQNESLPITRQLMENSKSSPVHPPHNLHTHKQCKNLLNILFLILRIKEKSIRLKYTHGDFISC